MAKAMSIKLSKKKPSTPRKPKFADESYTGPEPVWDDWQTWPIEKFHKEKQRVSTYYNYFYTPKDLRPKVIEWMKDCLLYTSPSPRDVRSSRMPSSA